MSKRNFIRRFKKATHNTPFEYLQRVKIEAAKKALEKGTQNINLLMYDAGYNDIKTFREVFKKITGLVWGGINNVAVKAVCLFGVAFATIISGRLVIFGSHNSDR